MANQLTRRLIVLNCHMSPSQLRQPEAVCLHP